MERREQAHSPEDARALFSALKRLVGGDELEWTESKSRVVLMPGIPFSLRSPLRVYEARPEVPFTVLKTTGADVLLEKIARENVINHLSPENARKVRDDAFLAVITDKTGKNWTFGNSEFSFLTGLKVDYLAEGSGVIKRRELKSLYTQVEEQIEDESLVVPDPAIGETSPQQKTPLAARPQNN